MLLKQKRINEKSKQEKDRESNKRLQTMAEKLNNLKEIQILEIEEAIIKHKYKKLKAEDRDFL